VLPIAEEVALKVTGESEQEYEKFSEDQSCVHRGSRAWFRLEV
jgi:hypothetical protein